MEKKQYFNRIIFSTIPYVTLQFYKVNNRRAAKSPEIVKIKERDNMFYFVCGFGKHCEDFQQKLKVFVRKDCTSDDSMAEVKPGR